MIRSSKRSTKSSISFDQPLDIIYWTKKWEISPHQLLAAVKNTKSTSVARIATYLKQFGFANLSIER